jgi:hypothetical protein
MTVAALAEKAEIRPLRAATPETVASAPSPPPPASYDVYMTPQGSAEGGDGAAADASPESQPPPSVESIQEDQILPTLTKGLAFAAAPADSARSVKLARAEPIEVPADDNAPEPTGAADADVEHADDGGGRDSGDDGEGGDVEVVDDEAPPSAPSTGTRSVGRDDCALIDACLSVSSSARSQVYYDRDAAVHSRGPFTESTFAPFAFRLNAGAGTWTAPEFVPLPRQLSASLRAAADTAGRSVFVSAEDAAGRTYKPAAAGDFSLPVFVDGGELQTYACPLASASFGAGRDFHSALERLTKT